MEKRKGDSPPKRQMSQTGGCLTDELTRGVSLFAKGGTQSRSRVVSNDVLSGWPAGPGMLKMIRANSYF